MTEVGEGSADEENAYLFGHPGHRNVDVLLFCSLVYFKGIWIIEVCVTKSNDA